jgi:hypothetical protein
LYASNLNNGWGNDVYGQLQILNYRVSTYSRNYFKGINLENEIRVKNKQNKTTFNNTSKKRWIFFKLAEWVDRFIFKPVLCI